MRPAQRLRPIAEATTPCMVVDNDRVCRLAVLRHLAKLGRPALAAASAEYALKQTSMRPPAVVLIATCLPQCKSYPVVMSLRRMYDYLSQDLRLLMSFPAIDGDGHRFSCATVGINSLLAKAAFLPELARTPLQGVQAAGKVTSTLQSQTSRDGSGPLMELLRLTALEDLERLAMALTCGDVSSARAFAHRQEGASDLVEADLVASIAAAFEMLHGALSAAALVQSRTLRWLWCVLRDRNLAPRPCRL